MTLATQDIDDGVDRLAEALEGLATQLHQDPELAFAEHRAVARITALLRQHGAHVQHPFGGLDTAFRAQVGGAGPRVAILAEYDALPEVGHACGHNLIAAGAVGAWLALLPFADRLGGSIELIGTPAEEGGGGKVRLLEAGAFEGIDAAMMFHPFDRDVLMHPALATSWLKFEFEGAPSHAAIAPDQGRSALTACLDTFRLIDGQRVHFADGIRVHGIVVNGGDAVNIIPHRATAEFSVRAPSLALLDAVVSVVERCGQGAAMASGVEVTISAQQGYREMRNNRCLAECFGAHLRQLGRSPVMSDASVGAGSTDMGDVSQQLPAIHPWLAICDPGEAICHQRQFERCACEPRGFETMLIAAKALARTAAEVLIDETLRSNARKEFAST